MNDWEKNLSEKWKKVLEELTRDEPNKIEYGSKKVSPFVTCCWKHPDECECSQWQHRNKDGWVRKT